MAVRKRALQAEPVALTGSISHLSRIAGATDLSLFWEALVALLQENVPHSTTFLWYDYVDFSTSSLATRVFEAPQLERAADYWENRRRSHLTPQYLNEHPGTILHRLSDIAPAERIRSTEFYQRFMRPEGWEHGVTLAFWEKGLTRATLVLYRTHEQGNFTDQECHWLTLLHPLIEAVLFRMIDQYQQQAVQDAMGDFVRGLPIGLILLNWDLQPVYVNDAGYAQALAWNVPNLRHHDPRADFRVPSELRRHCEQFRLAWLQRRDSGSCIEKVQHPRDEDLRAVVSMHQVRSFSVHRPTFLIRFTGVRTRTHTTAHLSESQLSILAQLTPTEREVTLLVRQGLSNRQIAEQLHREVCTIKDHLGHIYRKLDIRTRTQLVSMLVEGPPRIA
ncbi:LuxR C-terminal-related transcriptional regulator [Steroidobacter flavus]|uniref:LuxR C-terminal-related transcriptional regulator n=1 Tax=Steroidobacter flavus TaxID=1842136 RepID=A0ABV8T2T8_9GAMM